MFFSPSTNGFYDPKIHGKSIPPDAVEIDHKHHAYLLQSQSEGKIIKPDSKGLPIAVDPPPPGPPQRVTMRQARLALLQEGLISKVTDAISELPSPQKETALIEWEYSQEVRRNQPLVQILADILGLDDEAIDGLFIKAASL